MSFQRAGIAGVEVRRELERTGRRLRLGLGSRQMRRQTEGGAGVRKVALKGTSAERRANGAMAVIIPFDGSRRGLKGPVVQ